METVKGSNQDSLGNRIRRARLAKFMSLELLADKLGVSKVTIWNWENNRTIPRYPRYEELSAALGVSLEFLVAGGESPGQNVSDLIFKCQCQIADAVGVQPHHVEIKVTFDGQSA